MRGLAMRVLEAVLIGAASLLGVRLAQDLQDPCSELRLRSSAVVDRLREVKR